MRFLIHSEDATYDPIAKRYIYNLDRQIAQPSRLIIRKVQYTGASSTSDTVHTVYLRSDKLHQASRQKHTVELKDDQHEDSSNVLAVLTPYETLVNRYKMERREVIIRLHPHIAIRKLDFYFTNNRTILDAVYTAPSVPGVTEQDILDLYPTYVQLWVQHNYSAQDTIIDYQGNEADIDETVHYVKGRLPLPFADLTFISSGTNKVRKVLMGSSGAVGVTGDVSSAWEYILDSVGNDQDIAVGSYVFLMRTPPTTALEQIWDSRCLRLYIGYGEIRFRAFTANYHTILPINTDEDYIITCSWDHSQDTVSNVLTCTAERLQDGSVTTNTVTVTGQTFLATGTFATRKYLSSAQTHMNFIMSDFIGCTSDASTLDTCRTFLRQVYTADTSGTPGDPDPDASDASFFVQLDIDAK